MSVTTQTDSSSSGSLKKLGDQVDAVAQLSRQAVIAALWLGALVLIVWFVIGIISGFVSLNEAISALLGAGGLGTTAELVRRFDKSKGAENG